MPFFPKAALVAGAAIALSAAPAASAHSIYGPDLGVEGQSLGTSVALKLTLTPAYSTRRPGVTVTLTNCSLGQRTPIRVLRRIGPLGSGQTLQSRPGKVVWSLATMPGTPARPTLRLQLAIPKLAPRFCVHTTMYDAFTRTFTHFDTRVPLH